MTGFVICHVCNQRVLSLAGYYMKHVYNNLVCPASFMSVTQP